MRGRFELTDRNRSPVRLDESFYPNVLKLVVYVLAALYLYRFLRGA